MNPERERDADTAAKDDAGAGTSRRMFIAGAAVVGAGLLVPWYFLRRGGPGGASSPVDLGPGLQANAFVHIAPDDTITVILGKAEMGQGIYTGLTQILAEELDVDPRRVRVEFAPVNAAYNHPFMPLQFTGGSMSTNSSYDQLRQAGATARAMLLAAAAARWGVDIGALSTSNGVVSTGSQRAKYGELAEEAARIAPPREVKLKDPSEFRYIGRSIRRLDGKVKVTGAATFGLDVVRPDMLYAVVARPPALGATPRAVDDAAARAIAGVVEVRTISSGVAVLGTNTWAARQGRDALAIDWAPGPDAAFSTAALRERYRALAAQPGVEARNTGDVAAALAGAAHQLDVEYELPFLAHSCMEPLNCVAHVTAEGCEIWTGSQFQSVDRDAAAAVLGMKPEQVELHTTFLGGGFGRRANPRSDFIVEAVELAKAVGKPVKVTWTREDDTRGGWYRPFGLSRVRAGTDVAGLPVAWHHTIVAQPVLVNTAFQAFVLPDGRDPTVTEGIGDMPYAIANLRVESHQVESPVPVQWWRSVGHSHTGFVVNGVIDELAALAKRDPLEVRRALLREQPRHLAVLNAVAQRAGWGTALPRGHHLGIALHASFGSIVAQAAEVSVEKGRVRVHRVTCGIDCGQVVNPGQVIAQMESSVVYGLSAALYGEISFENGAPVQSNFDDYRMLRLDEMPFVDTIIVPGNGPMGGVGECGVPPIAPAVCGAIYAATGRRIRRLPIALPG
jgi:isoquinoline 1-oxidoreductase beta subunit